MCIKKENSNLIVKSVKKNQTKKVNRIVEQDTVKKAEQDLAFMKKIESTKVHSIAIAASEYNAYQSTIKSNEN